MKNWSNWIDAVSKAAAAISSVLVGVVAVHIVADAVARSMFRAPLPGTLEFTQYGTMPAAVALALGYALYRAEHIRVDLLTSGAGHRARRVVEIVAMAVTLAVVALAAWAGLESAMDSVLKNEASEGSRWILIWPGRIAVAVGLLVLALQTVAQLIRAFADELPESVEEALVHAAIRGAKDERPLAEPALGMTPRGMETH